MESLVNNIDDDNFKIVGKSSCYNLYTAVDSKEAPADDKPLINQQKNQPTSFFKFNPIISTPLIICPAHIKKAIISGLTQDEKMVLRYYINMVCQQEIASRMNKSSASVGRLLKNVKLKFFIRTRNINETYALLFAVYGLKISESLISRLLHWSFIYYGLNSDIYKKLYAEYVRLREQRRLLNESNEVKR